MSCLGSKGFSDEVGCGEPGSQTAKCCEMTGREGRESFRMLVLQNVGWLAGFGSPEPPLIRNRV